MTITLKNTHISLLEKVDLREGKAMGKSCVFFGHRWVFLKDDEKKALHDTIIDLINNHGVDEFVFGGYGDFDSLAYRTVTEIKKEYPHIRRTYAQAYFARNQEDMDYLNRAYEFVYLPEGTEEGPLKFSISRRNRKLAKDNDFMICYVNTEYGGAYTAMKVALANKKVVINIAELNKNC